MPVQRVTFEVFGRVQGVNFRHFTNKQAKRVGAVGWCMNTAKGTVTGELQGTQEQIQQMQDWLREEGSPASKIEHVEFGQVEQIDRLTLSSFEIRRGSEQPAPATSASEDPTPDPGALFRTGSHSRNTRTGARDPARNAAESAASGSGERRAQRRKAAKWLEGKTESPQFVALEAVLALAFLALLDGGLSGDWLKYGYIDASTQASLTSAAAVGALFHGLIGAYAAAEPARSGRGGAALLAFARGFLCGTIELVRVLNKREAASS